LLTEFVLVVMLVFSSPNRAGNRTVFLILHFHDESGSQSVGRFFSDVD
jgi:hypothetical protein